MEKCRIGARSVMVVLLLTLGCASKQKGHELDHYGSARREPASGPTSAASVAHTPARPNLTEASKLSDYLT